MGLMPGVEHGRLRRTGRSASPVVLSTGLDPTGEGNRQAASSMWYHFHETGEEIWVLTQVAVRGTGETFSIILKGYHPFAAQAVRRCLTMCPVDLGL